MKVFAMKFVGLPWLEGFSALEMIDQILEMPALYTDLEKAKAAAQTELAELWELLSTDDTVPAPSLEWKESEKGFKAEVESIRFIIQELEVS